MYIDEWATAITTLDIPGVDVEDLLLLVDWTSRNDVQYALTVPRQNANGKTLAFTMCITCSNLQAHEVREMWTKYQLKKKGA